MTETRASSNPRRPKVGDRVRVVKGWGTGDNGTIELVGLGYRRCAVIGISRITVYDTSDLHNYSAEERVRRMADKPAPKAEVALPARAALPNEKLAWIRTETHQWVSTCGWYTVWLQYTGRDHDERGYGARVEEFALAPHRGHRTGHGWITEDAGTRTDAKNIARAHAAAVRKLYLSAGDALVEIESLCRANVIGNLELAAQRLATRTCTDPYAALDLLNRVFHPWNHL